MADELFYAPDRTPPPPRQPQLGERVWTLRKAGKRVDCELRFHGESYGWEVQRLFNGDLAFGRRFVLREHALEEAEAQWRRLFGEGWRAPKDSAH